MDIASQLAVIRQQQGLANALSAAGPQAANISAKASLLFSPTQAAALPLADIAAMGANGCAQLAVLDQRLLPLLKGLAFQGRIIDRAILDSESNKLIHQDILSYLIFASPHFLHKANLKCLEWMLRGLNLLEYPSEIHALLCMAIPYYDTPIFDKLLQLILQAQSKKDAPLPENLYHWSQLANASRAQLPITRRLISIGNPNVLTYIAKSAFKAAFHNLKISPLYTLYSAVVCERLFSSLTDCASSAHAETNIRRALVMEAIEGLTSIDSHPNVADFYSACLTIISTAALASSTGNLQNIFVPSSQEMEIAIRAVADIVAIKLPRHNQGARNVALLSLFTLVFSKDEISDPVFQTLCSYKQFSHDLHSIQLSYPALQNGFNLNEINNKLQHFVLAYVKTGIRLAINNAKFPNHFLLLFENISLDHIATDLVYAILNAFINASVHTIQNLLPPLLTKFSQTNLENIEQGVRLYLLSTRRARGTKKDHVLLSIVNTAFEGANLVAIKTETHRQSDSNDNTKSNNNNNQLSEDTLWTSLNHPNADIRLKSVYYVEDLLKRSGPDREFALKQITKRTDDDEVQVAATAINILASHQSADHSHCVKRIFHFFNLPDFLYTYKKIGNLLLKILPTLMTTCEQEIDKYLAFSLLFNAAGGLSAYREFPATLDKIRFRIDALHSMANISVTSLNSLVAEFNDLAKTMTAKLKAVPSDPEIEMLDVIHDLDTYLDQQLLDRFISSSSDEQFSRFVQQSLSCLEDASPWSFKVLTILPYNKEAASLMIRFARNLLESVDVQKVSDAHGQIDKKETMRKSFEDKQVLISFVLGSLSKCLSDSENLEEENLKNSFKIFSAFQYLEGVSVVLRKVASTSPTSISSFLEQFIYSTEDIESSKVFALETFMAFSSTHESKSGSTDITLALLYPFYGVSENFRRSSRISMARMEKLKKLPDCLASLKDHIERTDLVVLEQSVLSEKFPKNSVYSILEHASNSQVDEKFLFALQLGKDVLQGDAEVAISEKCVTLLISLLAEFPDRFKDENYWAHIFAYFSPNIVKLLAQNEAGCLDFIIEKGIKSSSLVVQKAALGSISKLYKHCDQEIKLKLFFALCDAIGGMGSLEGKSEALKVGQRLDGLSSVEILEVVKVVSGKKKSKKSALPAKDRLESHADVTRRLISTLELFQNFNNIAQFDEVTTIVEELISLIGTIPEVDFQEADAEYIERLVLKNIAAIFRKFEGRIRIPEVKVNSFCKYFESRSQRMVPATIQLISDLFEPMVKKLGSAFRSSVTVLVETYCSLGKSYKKYLNNLLNVLITVRRMQEVIINAIVENVRDCEMHAELMDFCIEKYGFDDCIPVWMDKSISCILESKMTLEEFCRVVKSFRFGEQMKTLTLLTSKSAEDKTGYDNVCSRMMLSFVTSQQFLGSMGILKPLGAGESEQALTHCMIALVESLLHLCTTEKGDGNQEDVIENRYQVLEAVLAAVPETCSINVIERFSGSDVMIRTQEAFLVGLYNVMRSGYMTSKALVENKKYFVRLVQALKKFLHESNRSTWAQTLAIIDRLCLLHGAQHSSSFASLLDNLFEILLVDSTLRPNILLSISQIIRKTNSESMQYVPPLMFEVASVLDTCSRETNEQLSNSRKAALVVVGTIVDRHLELCVGDAFNRVFFHLGGFLRYEEGVARILNQISSKLEPRSLLPALDYSLSRKIDECSKAGNADELYFMQHSLRQAINSFKKKDIKKYQKQISQLIFESIRYRSLSEGHRQDKTYDEKLREDILGFEASLSETLLCLAMRLSETDFNTIFLSLLEWYNESEPEKVLKEDFLNEESLQDAVQLQRCMEVYQRISPVLRFVNKLLEGLQILFAPYVLHLFEECTRLVQPLPKECVKILKQGKHDENVEGSKKKEKKRNRHSVMNEDKVSFGVNVLKTREQLSIEILSILEKFFLFYADEISNEIFDQALASILARYQTFDEAFVSGVASLFAQFASKISTGDDVGRKRLGIINRHILSPSQDRNSHHREVCVRTVRIVAEKVGEEYLANLPETLPYLADLIEDESPPVEKATREFIATLETMSGESIWDHLSK